MIIWLASYPRSGNTYFRILLNHFYGLNTTSLYREEILYTAFKSLGFYPISKPVEEIMADKELYWVKTHELPSDDFPAIYLVRDGRDVLLSYTWYILTLENAQSTFTPPNFWKTLHALILDNNYFGGWGSHVLAWTQRQAPTAVIKFEDLVKAPNPLNIVRQALTILDYPLSEELTTTPPPMFAELHQKIPRFFRKGQINSWRREMPPKLHELFWQKYGDAMREMGYISAIHNSRMTLEQRIIFEEKEKGMTELSDTAEHRLQLICQYENELTLAEEIIQSQQKELVAKEQIIQEKEQVIQELHTLAEERLNIIHYLQSHPLRIFLKHFLPLGIQNGIRQIRRWFQPKLGQLRQYPPIPLKIPKHYYTLTGLAQQSLPVVSIVTPSFNQAQFLERTINSVIKQNYPNLEYIIQDGASTDQTSQILEKYRSQLSYVESCQDNGQAHAINLGFCHASGDIMAWLNSDDLLLPGAVAYIVKFFRDHPELDVVYGHRIVINEDEKEIGRWILPPHENNALLWADYIPQETIFWRRRIWEKAGGYLDESYHFALDWELLLRFREAGATFVRLPRFLAAFRVHEHQKTSKELEGRGSQEMHRLRERCHGHHVSHEEAHYNIRHYMRKHILYDKMSRFGVLRY